MALSHCTLSDLTPTASGGGAALGRKSRPSAGPVTLPPSPPRPLPDCALPLLQRLIQPGGVRQVAGRRGGDVVAQALGVDQPGLEQRDRGQIGSAFVLEIGDHLLEQPRQRLLGDPVDAGAGLGAIRDPGADQQDPRRRRAAQRWQEGLRQRERGRDVHGEGPLQLGRIGAGEISARRADPGIVDEVAQLSTLGRQPLTTVASKRARSSAEAMSVGTTSAGACGPSLSRTASRRACRRPTSTTPTPRAASACASAAPIPEPAPVIRAQSAPRLTARCVAKDRG